MYSTLYNLALDRRRWTVISAALVLIAAMWVAASAVPAASTTQGRIPSPREGFLAPELRLADQNGEAIALGDLHGSVIVLNFWASWCPPCRAEMPALREVYLENRDRGLEVLAVNSTFQDSRSAALAFAAEFDLPFTLLFDESGDVSNRYLVRALPTTYFIDREGVIRKLIVGGPMSTTILQTTVESLLTAGP